MKYLDRFTIFWLVIAAAFFLPGLGNVHLFDWDEINFAELAREMVVTGDWLRLQINYELFTEKPPFFFWLQGISMHLLGVGEYAARLPNALLGMLVLPFLYVSGKFLIDRKFGFLWALSWFGSVLPFLYFKSGIIDPYFNFFTFNGLFFLIHLIWKKKGREEVYFSKTSATYLWLAGISMGLAVLTKGPVAYLVITLTLGSYWLSNGFKTGLPFVSFVKFSLIGLSVFSFWLLVDMLLHGPAFLIEFTIRQWELLTQNDAGHGGFPGYHFVVLLAGCFPASIFALRGFSRISGLKAPHLKDFQRWMVTLLLVVLVLFSLVNTKIVHYSSLAYYPLTYLSALVLWHYAERQKKLKYWMIIGILIIGFLALALSIALPWAGNHIETLKPLFEKDPFARANLQAQVNWAQWHYLPAVFLGLVLLVFSVFARKRQVVAIRVLFMGTAIWCALVLGFFIKNIEAYSQKAAVGFFEDLVQEECYVTTFGYKSYVPWFYAKIQSHTNPNATQKEWLYHGKVDRPVYICTKINKVEKLEEAIPDAQFLYAKNGFFFYKRDPKP